MIKYNHLIKFENIEIYEDLEVIYICKIQRLWPEEEINPSLEQTLAGKSINQNVEKLLKNKLKKAIIRNFLLLMFLAGVYLLFMLNLENIPKFLDIERSKAARCYFDVIRQ